VRSVTPVTEALLADTPVRFVGSATIGTDHVDLDALDRLGIAFACAPGCNARAVAEHVLQALLMASQHHGRPLRGSTVGVIGLGNVGGLVAAWLRALGVEVLGCDPPLARAGRVTSVSLDEALAADAVTLHVPLIKGGDEATRHLLDKTRLRALNHEQTLINTCRGPVVDNQALSRRLARGDGPLTFLDVWEGEPRLNPALLEQVFNGSPMSPVTAWRASAWVARCSTRPGVAGWGNRRRRRRPCGAAHAGSGCGGRKPAIGAAALRPPAAGRRPAAAAQPA
jgi:erythronate-4-phosphate dehydrogenase